MSDRMERSAGRFEYATETDPSLNYCLWNYSPPAGVADKFRSVNLLYNSFDVAGLDDRAFEIIDAIRDGIGPFRTVYGVKLAQGSLGWELYFYDYERRSRRVSVKRLREAIAPVVRCPVEVSEALPYFMFSLDIDDCLARGERELDELHLYIGNPGSAVSSGIAYSVTRDGTTLDNFYFFFDAATQLADVQRKVASSPFFDETTVALDQLILPELRHCKTICIANKKTHDCIYFSGIDIHQLIWFLNRFEYPSAIRRFVADRRGLLDHLLFDVGFDYRQEGAALTVLKSGYYGVF